MTCEFDRELTKLEKSIEETRRECETVEHLEWLRTEIRKVISRLTDIANDELLLEPPVEWPDEPEPAPLGTSTCGLCGRTSAVYEVWPICTECAEVACPTCESTLSRVEDDGCVQTRCKECAATVTVAELMEDSQRKALTRLMAALG